MTVEFALALGVLALVAGVGISALGSGGVLVTVALFAFTPLSVAAVAGTASATFAAAGLLSAAVYRRSGEFEYANARETAALLSATGVAGALAGSATNLRVLPDRAFGGLLAAFVAGLGVLIVYRELAGLDPTGWIDRASPRMRRALVGLVGIGIGVLAGLLGVGGPILAVPVLVVLGVPVLAAVAIAQTQAVFVSGIAAASYLAADAVSVPLALLVGVPQLLGVVLGWRIAHLIEPRRLRIALGATLVAIAPAIAL
ncbi:sulfite exporter TauE/SafE family protein [Halalkalicoccus sp. NIPERK01]|uniref:sulfite exporter TauE/SafE family protein n=1 Tax=Halalkalicoccus sp. NIPERK01 TaxID=3053469 RepID=UPI00256EB10C|nr:sulfite exporter TauE/SafE family protein [Halalkalicoccus sp. NIPERK01]MDL5361569.1 sulfite exporter TauE/SafE family protein [Halalkalicoccus sp. NIPERK01]